MNGAARFKLYRIILFNMLQHSGENICFRCGESIETEQELSLDHKAPWLGNDAELFWDLDNIAWSHAVCNSRHGAVVRQHMYEPSLTKEVSRKGRCTRWNINRGLPCQCGYHNNAAVM